MRFAMTSTLIDLPAEIRLHILHPLLVAETGEVVVADARPRTRGGKPPSSNTILLPTTLDTIPTGVQFLFTCKLLYREGVSILYSRNKFCISLPQALEHFFIKIGNPSVRLLRKLHIELDEYDVENQALVSIIEWHKDSLMAVQLVKLKTSHLATIWDRYTAALMMVALLSCFPLSIESDITKILHPSFSVKEEILGLRYDVDYEQKQEDVDRGLLTTYIIKVVKNVTLKSDISYEDASTEAFSTYGILSDGFKDSS
jgi:hypothetical protein